MCEQTIKSYIDDEEANEDLKLMNKKGWVMDCISNGSKATKMMGRKHPTIYVGYTRCIKEKVEYKTPDGDFKNNLKKGVDRNG